MLLSGIALSGCALSDDYAVRRNAGAADDATGGSGNGGESGASGEVPTGGDTSDTGGTSVTTGGAANASGGSSGDRGETIDTGGAPHETGGTSGTGGEHGDMGGTPNETGGGAGTGGKPASGGASGTGSANGGAPEETGGTSGTGGNHVAAGGAAGTTESGGTGGTELGGAPNAGQGGMEAYAGSAGTAGTAGTDDLCPDNDAKTAPGVCGCDMQEADCLAHRFSFDGTGTTVGDSVGEDNGTVHYGGLSGNGALTFSGGAASANATYVDFPNGILSTLTVATLELWVTWDGGEEFQRILDFGNYTQSGSDTSGKTYVYLTPRTGLGTARASFTLNGSDYATSINPPTALSTGEMSHVAVVLGTGVNGFRLYINGTSQGSETLPAQLSSLEDDNNWLGRSQFNDDAYFEGKIHEFRIYKTARTSDQIAASFAAGPDVPSGE